MLVMQSLRHISLVLLFLLALIFIPVIFAGYADLHFAESASSAHDRSLYYESAAQRLLWRADFYEMAGSAALDAGEYKRAISLFKVARLKSVLTSHGQFQLGQAYLFDKNEAQALAEWEGLSDGDAFVAASPYLADAYHAQARFDDEKQVLHRWLSLDPQSADAHYRLGLLLFADASPDAIPLLEFASANSPALKPGADGLRVSLKTALEDASVAGALTSCGQTLAAMNEWSLALKTFSHATQIDENNALAWAWLAETRQHIAGSGDALIALQRAIKLAPASAQIHAMMGLYWQRQNDWQQAHLEYAEAARLEPGNAIWQISLGDVDVHMGNLVTALAYYQHAVAVEPRNVQAWRALALFSVENDDDVEDTGRNAALRAYSLEPDNVENIDVLGRALMMTSQYDAAEVLFKKALTLSPSAAAPAYHLGLLYLQTNQGILAKEYFHLAQKLDPTGTYGDQAGKILARYFP